MLTEVARVRCHGFSEGEFRRAVAELQVGRGQRGGRAPPPRPRAGRAPPAAAAAGAGRRPAAGGGAGPPRHGFSEFLSTLNFPAHPRNYHHHFNPPPPSLPLVTGQVGGRANGLPPHLLPWSPGRRVGGLMASPIAPPLSLPLVPAGGH